MSDFKKLLVWQKAHALALNAHRTGAKIRRAYDVGLRTQINRTAFSIPTNIVEGRRQESEKEFARFLRIALNSGVELEYHLMIARDIGALAEADCDTLIRETIEVRKMLHGLIVKVSSAKQTPICESEGTPTNPAR